MDKARNFLRAERMRPNDYGAFERQASQRVQLGLTPDTSPAQAQALIDGGEAWSLFDEAGEIIACMGIFEMFPGRQGEAWAAFARLGPHHLALTRFARGLVQGSRLMRVQAHCRTDAEIAWAQALGMTIEAVLPAYGAASEDHVLLSRIHPNHVRTR